MLFQHLDRLSSDDLLLMDLGYASRWLVAVLTINALHDMARGKLKLRLSLPP